MGTENLKMKANEKQDLERAVELAYDSTKFTRGRSEEEILSKLDEYDLLVDKLVKLTNGTGSAYYTDPMQADDYKALLGKSAIGMTYNEMAEEMGATFIDGLCGERR